MVNSNVRRQPKPILDTPKSTPPKIAVMRDPVPSQDEIRERAYQLYENRGCQPGQDQQDWLRAEQELLDQR